MEQKNRVKWIDIAKGIAILLIVYGHVMRSGVSQKIVYAFHVPTFFFLSGMNAKTNNFRKSIANDAKKLLIPYFSFGIISIVVFSILGNFVAEKFNMDIRISMWTSFWELLYGSCRNGMLKFNAPIWFLPSLFALKLVYYCLHHFLNGDKKRVFASSVVLSAVSFWYTESNLWPMPFSFELSLKFLPLFVLGKEVLPLIHSFSKKVARKHTCILGVAVLVCVCTAAMYAPAIGYTGNNFPNIWLFWIIALLGCAGVCELAVGIHNNEILEYVGKNTLSILVMHKFPVVFFQTIGPFEMLLKDYDSAVGIFCGGVPVTIISVLMCLFAGHMIKKVVPSALGIIKHPQ